MLFIFFYHLLLATEQLVNAITTYKIGTTESIDSMHYHNLRFAIDSWNHANTIYNEVSLELIFASTTGSTVDERMCDILQRNLVAVVVSTVLSPLDSSLLQSMCLHFHVPCLTLVDNSDDENNFVTNVSPKRGLLTSAIAQLIEHLRWNTFLLIYSERRDLIELNELISGWSSTSKVRPIVKARQLPQNIEDLQPFLKYIRQLQQNNIVMHSNNISTIFSFLRQASSLNMTESRYSYIFTNPDLSLLDHFLNSADSVFQCNITGVQIVKTDPSMKTELALTMDAVDAIGAALLKLKSQELSPVATPLLCDAHDTWFDGEMMNGAIRNVSLDSGSTGKLMFTANGQRSDLFIDGMGRINGEIVKLGNWSEESGWKFDPRFANKWEFEIDPDAETLEGLTLRVVVHLEEPFVMTTESAIGYEGFCIDLLIEMAQILKFNFTIIEVSDGTYGIEDESGRWNGLIGVLQRHEADLSVSAVTITYSRAEVIDFTLPFMHLGISILLAKTPDDQQKTKFFTFLEPLSFSVWISLMGAYLVVSSTMWLLAKFSPYEWYDIQQIDERDRSMDERKNQFTILNSLWFAVGSLMQQGSDVIPRAAATRIVAVVWWMYTLIMISSYTAQLAAFLTVERMTTPIESTADLAAQQKIKYGTLNGGSTMNFFRESKIPIYERMWSVMQSTTPTVFVNSSREGIARAKGGNYAYMMESSMLEYYMERDCQLQRIGGLLDSKGYGIALPKGSPLRDILSQTVLKLQERTILEALKNKWWKDKRGVSSCGQTEEQAKTSSFRNILGIFYILLVGLLIAIFLAIGEYCIESRNESYRLNLTLIGKFRSWWDRTWATSKLEKKRRKLQNIQLDTTHETERPICEFDRSVFHRQKRRSNELVIPYPQMRRLSRMLPMGDEILLKTRISNVSETLE